MGGRSHMTVDFQFLEETNSDFKGPPSFESRSDSRVLP